ncbi:hypothetical protein [Hymenobacter metallilatus]|uniref:Uncharacterized protein n=1 Tax=Hymenobacter metallilatus TaxID=2493666 RepID=A0A428JFK6_9BACT|nr:hypothetical protein [Hymenobacter metallilatus]RSK31243.1 hypothetical protein EI290_14590 [Hymenobacter metallilatus]
MLTSFRLPAAAAVLSVFFLLAVLLAGCTKEQDQPTPASSLSVTEASDWYKSIHPAQPATIRTSAYSQRKDSSSATLNWSKAFSLSQDGQSLVLVPYQGDHALFARSAVKGVRYLIVTKKATIFDGVTIEILLKPTAAGLDTLSLLTDLYRSYSQKNSRVPLAGEGAVLFYNQEYHFLTGHFFTHAGVLKKSIRLMFQPRQASADQFGPSNRMDFVPEVGKCYDWYTPDGEYITTTGDCDGGIGGNGGYAPPIYTGGGGPGSQTPGSGSSSPHGPSGWGGSDPPSPKMVSRMPTSMPIQVGGGCVPASLAIIKSSLCAGSFSQNQNDIALYGSQQYGIFFMNDGVPLEDMGSFVGHFFNVNILVPAGNFIGAINNGYPILIDVLAVV